MKTLKQLTKEFGYINSNITDEKFPLVKREHKGYKLFHFDRYISSEDVIKEIEKEGFVPANLLELLEWKDWNKKDWVVALGSVGEVRGARHVPGLLVGVDGRHLGLCRVVRDWLASSRFLAVRIVTLKSELDNSALILGHLDSLEEIIKKVKGLLK